ncbi:MAG: hypothetical protein OEX12_08920 [Gammaproteobacteria bacterium]|nr:hypothetical protein [Gammaproteobacteria bacterium]
MTITIFSTKLYSETYGDNVPVDIKAEYIADDDSFEATFTLQGIQVEKLTDPGDISLDELEDTMAAEEPFLMTELEKFLIAEAQSEAEDAAIALYEQLKSEGVI